MEKSTYILFFYSIVIGLTATTYLKGWGELIQNRDNCKNWLVSTIWSVGFFVAIVNEWFSLYNGWEARSNIFDLFQILVIPFGIYIISELIFPKASNNECDYYKHFLKHKNIIYVITIAYLLWKFDIPSGFSQFNRTRLEVLVLLLTSVTPLFSTKKSINLICGVIFLVFWIYRIIIMSI